MSLADVVNIISKWINSDKASDSVADSGGTGFRVIRIFRLVRVFKLSRVMVDLRIIMDAMFRSLNGVTSAFLIFLLMVVLFSIMATSTFAQQDQELFGTFWRSLVTMLHCGLSPHTGFVLLNSLQGISIDRADRDDDLDMYLWNWTIDVFFSIYILLVFVLVQNLVVVVFLRELIISLIIHHRTPEHAWCGAQTCTSDVSMLVPPCAAELRLFGGPLPRVDEPANGATIWRSAGYGAAASLRAARLLSRAHESYSDFV